MSVLPWLVAGIIITAVAIGAAVLLFNTVVGAQILRRHPGQGGSLRTSTPPTLNLLFLPSGWGILENEPSIDVESLPPPSGLRDR